MAHAAAWLTLAALAVALALAAFERAPALALTHLVLSVGILPLILAAMLYFVPVLTRTRAPAGIVRSMPAVALAAGSAPVLAFLSIRPTALLIDAGALLALGAALSVGAWMLRRARRSLGAPHPGLSWYLAALGCLGVALGALLAMHLWPQHYLALRRVHLHLNTLGFVALTAVGTLQVLMPTVLGRSDPDAARRLRTDLPWALGGTVLIAAGAAWLPLLGYVGAALWLGVLARLAHAWWSLFRRQIFVCHGAAPSLAAALLGLALLLLAGVAHGERWLLATHAVAALFAAFLLPLVTGALSHLLPLWRRPAAPGAWHEEQRRRLQRGGALRAALFLGGGVLLLFGVRAGYAVAGAALVLFLWAARAIRTP